MDFCPLCNKVVAPHDPEREVMNNKVYHQDCIKKHLVRVHAEKDLPRSSIN